ncbi:MAG TPA: ABC transporter substrate-binding protein [Chthonomonadaceae bacterium]|nr:ABC transporter substrate-binding protein [Chthonomonadaceae bacterium]
MIFSRQLHRIGKWAIFALSLTGLAVLGAGCTPSGSAQDASGKTTLRLAYFPNVTHAPAMAGVARGDFQKALGDKATLDTKVVNAGPEAMEALLANAIDMSYVGPSPAINTYLKSQGKALRLLAGACSGGASLVARADVPIHSIKDLDGKRVAVPQFGGTQDVSCRHFLSANGLRSKDKGGTVDLQEIKNPDILALFKQKQLDAAWVPEPWAARLIADAGARRVVDERDLWPGKSFTTTVIVVRKSFLDEHPELVEAFLKAHLRETEWLQKNPEEGQKVVNAELKRLTGKALKADVLKDAWGRVQFTDDPNQSSIVAFMQAAEEAGYLRDKGADIAGLFDFTLLEKARRLASAK